MTPAALQAHHLQNISIAERDLTLRPVDWTDHGVTCARKTTGYMIRH